MSRRAALSLALGVLAAAGPAFAASTLQELARESRSGHEVLVKQFDPQGNLYEMGGGSVPEPRDEMDDAERARIMSEIDANRARLVAEGKLARVHAKALTNFAWPLRFAAGRTDFDFHAISNYVDQNPAFPTQVLDYNCGSRTYDLASGYNHRGTDIYSSPFGWNKMDDEDVVIAAGAPGTIVSKSDGNFDRNCAIGSGNWNAVYVQHADGSVAWYGHMKSGSTTVKGVGETVAKGEYLGIVGSSGSSTGPHLHLELYDSSNALVDPWLGACNTTMSKQVTWARQRPYRDTAVNALTVGTAAPNFPACPTPGTSFATDYVTPGATVYFTTYLRDQTATSAVSIRILRPDGSVYTGPLAGGTGDYNSSYWFWSRSNFPNVPGTWTFEATIAGRLFTKTFEVGGSPNFGAASSITALAGSSQVTAPGMPFASPLKLQVLDSLARPVKGARVTLSTPPSGATAVLESRTALTDASGIAAVTAIANAMAGSYQVMASVAGAGSPSVVTLQNTVPVVNGVSVSPAALAFGGQSMNTTAPTQAVTLTNVSGGVLSVSSVTVPANFAVSHICGTLAPGATCTANVTFTPGLAGDVAGMLGVTSGAGTTLATIAGTGERSLVTHYYRSILRRAPDAGGKTFWENEAARMQSLGVNVNETWFSMAGSFYTSAEYLAFGRDNTGFITDLYNTFFNRAPDAGGLAFWVGQLAGGMPREVALVGFMFSTEFVNFTQAVFGNTTARKEMDTVVDFYRGLLARLPDDGGFGFWVQQFRTAQCQGAGAVTTQAEAISSAYALSPEYSARARNNSQYVGDLYNAFLRRGGDLPGVQFWINQIATSAQSREQVRQQFVASPEFQARVATIIAQGCLP